MANPSEFGKKSRSPRDHLDDNGRNPRGQPLPKDDPWLRDNPDESSDLSRTSDEEHDEIMRRLRSQQEGASRPSSNRRRNDDEEPADDAEKLLAENQELRSIIAELKQCLDEQGRGGKGGGDQSWEEREREYELLLEEKSELIRELHVRIQELEKNGGGEGGAEGSGGRGSRDSLPEQEELLALSDELERERSQLDQERQQLEADRRQLREDEEAMMRQMREMELQMAKERAELARQRTELQRMHSEIRHELELAQRDAAVRERLEKLQRRHQPEAAESDDGGKKKSGQTPANKPSKGSGTSLFGRLFGGGDK